MIKIIDSIMGSGKSTAMLEYVKNNKDEKYLWITPFLSEVERVMNYEGVDFKRPMGSVTEERERATKLGLELDVVRGIGVNKFKQVEYMTENDVNVVSTHETFKRLDCGDVFSDYTLILDEVVKLVDTYDIKIKTVNSLESEGYIIIDAETGKITPTEKGVRVWGKTEPNLTRFLKNAEKGILYKAIEKVVVTEYPIELLTQFKNVYVLTYIFDGSYLKAFLDMHNVKYGMVTIDNNNIVDWNEDIYKKQIEPYRELFNVYNPRTNTIRGNYSHQMKKIGKLSSGSCHKMNKETCLEINSIIRKYAVSVGATSKDFIYTVYKNVNDKAGESIRGYSNSFLPYNIRATNEYSHVTAVAYCVSRHVNPVIQNYMVKKASSNNLQISFSDDKLALADMLQFVFRGCIRNKEKMNLFVGDESSLILFLNWLYS
ncbi:MAG: hypothetical protein ACRC0G_01165 [Fusobacteriaceae bacterium]